MDRILSLFVQMRKLVHFMEFTYGRNEKNSFVRIEVLLTSQHTSRELWTHSNRSMFINNFSFSGDTGAQVFTLMQMVQTEIERYDDAQWAEMAPKLSEAMNNDNILNNEWVQE